MKNLTATDRRIRDHIEAVLADGGITQAELASRLGWSPAYVNHVLRGERGKIPDSLLAILSELGLELTTKKAAQE